MTVCWGSVTVCCGKTTGCNGDCVRASVGSTTEFVFPVLSGGVNAVDGPFAGTHSQPVHCHPFCSHCPVCCLSPFFLHSTSARILKTINNALFIAANTYGVL